MVDGIDAKVTPLRKTAPCPECGKPIASEHYPFCSTRCQEIDLNRWLTGAYAIPVREDDPEEGDGSLPDDDQTGRE